MYKGKRKIIISERWIMMERRRKLIRRKWKRRWKNSTNHRINKSIYFEEFLFFDEG
jgi:hypothetical protein